MINDFDFIEFHKNNQAIFDSYPIGLYIVKKEGEFVWCNKKLEKILEIKDDIKNHSIIEFYKKREDRKTLLDEIDEFEKKGENDNAFLYSKMVEFNKPIRKETQKKMTKWVEISSRKVKTDREILYFDCLTEISENAQTALNIEEHSGAGIYRLDKGNKIVYVNPALQEMLNFKIEELIGEHVSFVYPVENKEEPDEIEKELKKNGLGVIKNRDIKLKKEDGELISLRMNCVKIPLDGLEYYGREGTLVDIHGANRYKDLIDLIKLGVYIVEYEGDKHLITECNTAFLDMFGYPNRKAAINSNVYKLWRHPEDKDEFIDFVKSNPGVSEEHELQKIDGSLIDAETWTSPITNKEDEVIGRVGIIRDMGKEFTLRKMRDDIGRVLHAYSSALMMFKKNLEPVVSHLHPDPFSNIKGLEAPDFIDIIKDNANVFSESLEKLLTYEKERKEIFSEDNWKNLKTKNELFNTFENEIPFKEMWISSFLDAVGKIRKIWETRNKNFISNEFRKQFEASLEELSMVCCLVYIHQTNDVIGEMSNQISSLREYVTLQARPDEETQFCNINSLLEKAVRNLASYANEKNVRIYLFFKDLKTDYWDKVRWDNNKKLEYIQRLNAYVQKSAITRALTNLLHNAIKYTWIRDSKNSKEDKYINIYIKQEEDYFVIRFENFGVGIPQDEIEEDTIFQIGHRGRVSGMRGRFGTGIGLSDARYVARKQGGDVTIESRPATKREFIDYKRPYLTTATIKIPKKIRRIK